MSKGWETKLGAFKRSTERNDFYQSPTKVPTLLRSNFRSSAHAARIAASP
jgi:hypothetical protein